MNVNFELSNGWSAASSTVGSERLNSPRAEEDALKPYTTCDLGPDFQIVEVDGPAKNFASPTETKNGKARIPGGGGLSRIDLLPGGRGFRQSQGGASADVTIQ